jgi:hypothetical protein
MVGLIEFRMSKLARMSDLYRQLADNFELEGVSSEIAALADEFDNEVARLNGECLGRRICPCEFSGSCLSAGCSDSAAEALNKMKAA